MNLKYSIKITNNSGFTSYLSYKGRTEWCKRMANKHLAEWKRLHAHEANAEIEEA